MKTAQSLEVGDIIKSQGSTEFDYIIIEKGYIHKPGWFSNLPQTYRYKVRRIENGDRDSLVFRYNDLVEIK
jgi:hypothetical protein